MNALVLLVIGLAVLIVGYLTYGRWLAKTWGVDPSRETPAHELEDGNDYCPAKAPVLLGHHFSSIAGAGPINGPIQAAVFGWVPVFLWVLIGGVFFGAVHDFGALFASIRHKGQSLGEVVALNIGDRAKKLFLIFSYLTLVLVVAAFASIVASTFVGINADGSHNETNASVAMISLLFIVMAVLFGFFVYRKGAKVGPATVIGVIGIVVITIIGLNVGVNISRTGWVIFIAVYITLASLLPVWILLQPRDYLSSFLLYAMMIIAIVGVLGGTAGHDFLLPQFTSFKLANGNTLFPVLFITVACGAISGFHSLVGSGTTSKQINSEKDAKVIGYGAMIIECVLALVSVISVGVVWNLVKEGAGGEAGTLTTNAPPAIFASGIASMVSWMTGGAADFTNPLYDTIYTLITLAVSVFALTSLDTGTRLGRYMFTELFVHEGEDPAKIPGFRGFLAKPLVGTLFLVIVGCGIGFLSLSQIWGLFGAANQLLAGLALMAVACWLGNIGKSNKMFFIPMVFMLVATLTSLVMTIISKVGVIGAGTAVWGDWFQLIFAAALVILAVVVSISGIQTFAKQAKGEITGDAKAVEATK